MHTHSHSSRRQNIQLVLWVNLAFSLIELIGGVLTHSMAVLSDALHDLGDSFALILSLYMEKVAERKRDAVFSFGYKRFSLLAALINGVILLVGSGLILSQAIPRIFSPVPVHTDGLLALAVLGILVNGWAALRLQKGKSSNEAMLSWHLLEDVLGWVAILIMGIAMKFGDFPFLDPLLSIAFAALIIWNAFKNVKKVLRVFLQSIPDDVDLKIIESKLCEHPLIVSVHDTHVWSLDGEYHVLTAHVVVAALASNQEITALKSQVRKQMEALSIEHTTLEIEYENDCCPSTYYCND